MRPNEILNVCNGIKIEHLVVCFSAPNHNGFLPTQMPLAVLSEFGQMLMKEIALRSKKETAEDYFKRVESDEFELFLTRFDFYEEFITFCAHPFLFQYYDSSKTHLVAWCRGNEYCINENAPFQNVSRETLKDEDLEFRES